MTQRPGRIHPILIMCPRMVHPSFAVVDEAKSVSSFLSLWYAVIEPSRSGL